MALRSPAMKNPHAQALGRLGGIARALALSKRQRLEISRKAIRAKELRAKIRAKLTPP